MWGQSARVQAPLLCVSQSVMHARCGNSPPLCVLVHPSSCPLFPPHSPSPQVSIRDVALMIAEAMEFTGEVKFDTTKNVSDVAHYSSVDSRRPATL